MSKSVAQYQKAFNNVIDKLKQSSSVLAVMVFGSMVSGDLWEESDIDLFVIVNRNSGELENIYTEEKDISVHIKLMNKQKFFQLCEEDLRGGFLHRVMAASKLVFSRDSEITSKFDGTRYYPDLDRERWNLTYLGNSLKSISVCRKCLFNNNVNTAFIAITKCIDNYSKLFINSSGYMISKDALIMAMNLDDNYRKLVEDLSYNRENPVNAINNILEYIEHSIDSSLSHYTSLLLNFMKEKDCFLSTEEIIRDTLFKNYDISMEDILNRLWEKNLIKKEFRDYKIENGLTVLKEKVYFI